MEGTRRFRGPNVVVVVGLLPLIVWAAFFIWHLPMISTAGAGYEIYYVIWFGICAYLWTMIISGVGCLWADRVLRAVAGGAPRTTRALVQTTSVILVVPWVLASVIGFVRWLR